MNMKDALFCVTSDHATPCALKVHSDTPVALLISGGAVKDDCISKFSEKECKKGSLGVVEHGYELMPKLMKLIKKQK
jgi:2,3-bisphosphoglycerate-independent phosphoglycerate mutase